MSDILKTTISSFKPVDYSKQDNYTTIYLDFRTDFDHILAVHIFPFSPLNSPISYKQSKPNQIEVYVPNSLGTIKIGATIQIKDTSLVTQLLKVHL